MGLISRVSSRTYRFDMILTIFLLIGKIFAEKISFKVDQSDSSSENENHAPKQGMKVQYKHREQCNRRVEAHDLVTVKFTIKLGDASGDIIQERKAYRFQMGEKPYPGFEAGIMGTCPGDIKY